MVTFLDLVLFKLFASSRPASLDNPINNTPEVGRPDDEQ